MPETGETALSEIVLEYLEPIPGDSETGADASNSEEYFKLNMEIQKTPPDYKLCLQFCETILKEKSKDLRVAAWFSFAMFRTEKMRGFRDGLMLIQQFLTKYGPKLYPVNEVHRSKALQFLNSSRYAKLVENEDLNKSNADDVIESYKILQEMIKECEKQFPGNIPVLTAVLSALKTKSENAEELKKGPVKPAGSEIKKEDRTSPAAAAPGTQVLEQRKPVSGSAEEVKLTSEKDAVIQLKKILNFFFEETSEGVKKEKIPEMNIVFGLSRQLQWGRMNRPAETDKVTQIDPPNQVIQGKIKEWFSAEAWDKLIPRVEINFLKGDSEFLYWLDAHRYVVKALDKMNSPAAEDIRYHLAKLINRIPDLPSLKFKDKITPFADTDTLKWINSEVLVSQSGTAKSSDMIAPPIMGEEYVKLNEEYETAAKGLPSKFEEGFVSIQEGIYADTRKKGKFLRRLNLANFCFKAKEYHLAKVQLTELEKLIEEYNLADWESALCTAVWQTEYLTNAKLIQESSKEQVFILEKEQRDLFNKIAKYNGILALKLTKKK